MDALSSTLEACAAFGPQQRAPAGLGEPLSVQGVQGWRVEQRRFTSPEGTRFVRLLVPDRTPRGLVPMPHGCRQTSVDFARATRFDRIGARHGLVVVDPDQARTQNPLGCWQWFHPGNQRRGRGEPAILTGLVHALVAAHVLDASLVFVAGLSAGGAMAAMLGTLYPDLFTAAGIHSGLPFGAARDVPGAFAAMAGNGGHATRRLTHPRRPPKQMKPERGDRGIGLKRAPVRTGTSRGDGMPVGAMKPKHQRTTCHDHSNP